MVEILHQLHIVSVDMMTRQDAIVHTNMTKEFHITPAGGVIAIVFGLAVMWLFGGPTKPKKPGK